MRRCQLICVCLVWMLSAPAHAQGMQPDLADLFPWEADVTSPSKSPTPWTRLFTWLSRLLNRLFLLCRVVVFISAISNPKEASHEI